MSNDIVLIQLFYAGLEYHFYHWEALWYRVIIGALYYFCTLYNRKKKHQPFWYNNIHHDVHVHESGHVAKH